MSRKTEREESKADEEREPAPETAGVSADERIAELESECEELRSKCARAQADYQNLRRRSQTDYELGLRREMQPLLDELLLVADYLDMALATPPSSEEARNLSVGVEMTRTKLMHALESQEVRSIPATGAFDPEIHEATGTEPAEGVEPGTVLRTVRKGYRWRDSVLRHAHVVVAAPADAGEESETEEPGPEGR